MSDPTCHDLIKASGNYIARCFQEPIGCVADDRIDCENGCMLKLAYKAGKDEADALIERLQKELGEARAREDQMRDACKYYADSDRSEMDTIRRQTIEECAKVAEVYLIPEACAAMSDGAFAIASAIAKAIRSMDGGGK